MYLNNEKEDLKTYPGFSFASAKANDVELRKALRGWVGVGRNYPRGQARYDDTCNSNDTSLPDLQEGHLLIVKSFIAFLANRIIRILIEKISSPTSLVPSASAEPVSCFPFPKFVDQHVNGASLQSVSEDISSLFFGSGIY
jgi:hypothetical protein